MTALHVNETKTLGSALARGGPSLRHGIVAGRRETNYATRGIARIIKKARPMFQLPNSKKGKGGKRRGQEEKKLK